MSIAEGTQTGPPPGTITTNIARYVRDLSLADLSPRLRAFTKLCLIDLIGCMFAGTTTRAGKVATDFVGAFDALPQAQVVGGRAVAVERAAFANTVLANANDFEPVGPEGHVTAVSVPSALALAQWRRASGADLLVAIAAGTEVAGRVGAAFRRPSSVAAKGMPMVRGTPHAIFASTVPAVKLLGLEIEEIRNAIGIAAYSAPLPTLRKNFDAPVPPMTKYDHLALQAQSGVDAARLAQLGFTGDRAAFEGEYGMWRFSGALGCDWDFLSAPFGGDWVIDATFFKSFPVVLYVHPSIDAVGRLVREHELGPEEIEGMTIRAAGLHESGMIIDDPLARWVNVRLNVAHYVCGTRPFTDWMNAVPSSQVAALAERIVVETRRSDRTGYWEGRSPADVTIRARGKEFRVEVTHIPRPDEKTLIEKFRANADVAGGAARAAEIVDLIGRLEDLPSIDPLIAALI
jgi:2-methylcitrate dehydratase PrpD